MAQWTAEADYSDKPLLPLPWRADGDRYSGQRVHLLPQRSTYSTFVRKVKKEEKTSISVCVCVCVLVTARQEGAIMSSLARNAKMEEIPDELQCKTCAMGLSPGFDRT